jgi:hypothetical protein
MLRTGNEIGFRVAGRDRPRHAFNPDIGRQLSWASSSQFDVPNRLSLDRPLSVERQDECSLPPLRHDLNLDGTVLILLSESRILRRTCPPPGKLRTATGPEIFQLHFGNKFLSLYFWV